MFAAWGRFVYRHRRAVAVTTLIATLVLGFFAANVTSHLSSGGWIVKDAESYRVQERLDAEFGTGGATIVAIFMGPDGTDARSDEFLGQVDAALAPLMADPLVAGAVGYREFPLDRFIATDGTGTYRVVRLAVTEDEAVDVVAGLEAQIAEPEGVDVQVAAERT